MKPTGLTDQEIISKATGSKLGEQFKAMWTGDYSAYPSHSEADYALCKMLAFWTGNDAVQIDSTFRQSGLMREK